MFKFRLAGTVAVIALVIQAAQSTAADVGPPASVPGNWSGFYLGAMAGYDDTSFDWQEDAGGGGYNGNCPASALLRQIG